MRRELYIPVLTDGISTGEADGAVAQASAVVYDVEKEGIVCVGEAGESYSGTRYQTWANCQLIGGGMPHSPYYHFAKRFFSVKLASPMEL